jgi:uncharacterized membrane protein HdeD (DUF308 family)
MASASYSMDPVGSSDLEVGVRRTITALSVAGGVVFLVIGLALLFWPETTLKVAAVLLGIQLILVGVLRFVLLFFEEAEGWVKALQGLLGVLLILAGVVCLRAPLATFVVLLVIVAIGWLIEGIATFVGSFRPFDGWRMAYAVVSVAAAIVVLVWPGLALATFVTLTAILLIVLGVVQLVIAWRTRAAAT